MKKTIAIVSLLLFATAGQLFAQKVSLQDFHFFKAINLKEGNNSVAIETQGTLRFVFRNGEVMNVMLQDPAGKIFRIAEPADPAANNPDPNPPCTGKLRCVQNTETNTAVCFCTPDGISATPASLSGNSIQYTKLSKSTR